MAASGDYGPEPSPNTERTSLTAAFGLEIRKLRRALGLSQEELANRSELDRTTVGRVERGEFRATLEVAAAMALACETPLWQLLQNIARQETIAGVGNDGC